MEVKPQVTNPPNYPNLRQRVNGRTRSVVQSLLNRELGLLFYSRVTESMSNFHIESSICRNLVMARTPDENIHDFPFQIHFPSKKVRENFTNELPVACATDFDRCPMRWFKVEFHYKHKLALINGFFWETEPTKTLLLQTTADLPHDNIYRFYGLPPDLRRGFELLWKTDNLLHGRVAAHDELYQELRVSHVKTKQSACLLTLSEIGCVSLCEWFDENPAEMRLISPLINAKFTDLAVNNTTGEIYIMSTQSGNVKMVYVLRYIKEICRLSLQHVIHVRFPVKMEFIDSMVIIGTNKHVIISSWELLQSATVPTTAKICTTQDSGTHCADAYEHVLSRMPETLERVETNNIYLGFATGFWPPQFYVRQEHGLCVKLQIGHLETLETFWEHPSTAHNESAVVAFPDESPRFLYTEDERYGVITLKRDASGSVVVDTESIPQPFDVPEQPPTFNTERTRPTLRRAKKVDSFTKSPNIQIFGLEYCSDLGLLAVCSARSNEGNCLHVSLYEAKTLTLWKELQPLYAWPYYLPSDMCTHIGKGRYTVKNFTMTFNHDLIAISMSYDDSTEDFFFIQLL